MTPGHLPLVENRAFGLFCLVCVSKTGSYCVAVAILADLTQRDPPASAPPRPSARIKACTPVPGLETGYLCAFSQP